MRITVVSIGKTKSAACAELEEQYLKRIAGRFECRQLYIKNEKELQEVCGQEKVRVVVLEEKGKNMDSHGFAQYLDKANAGTNDLYFVIGDAEGISTEVRALADDIVSLSELTFPHELTRVILLEQIYRAQTILSGHPYHK